MTIEKRQLAFGDALRNLREQAGFVTGKDFAAQTGWLPSKVSRIENGRTVPSDSDVIAWLDATEASDAVVSRVRDELRELRLVKASWKRRTRSGHAPVQRQIAAHERAATRLLSVEFYVVPGLVQTAEYARSVFVVAAEEQGHSAPDIDAAVRERLRRQEVLYDPAKRIEILVAETALRYLVCPPGVLLGQIDRLISLLGLPNVRVGVIPLSEPLPAITMHGYVAVDDEIVIELNHTEVRVTDPEDMSLYRRITDRLWSIAVEGDRARELLAAIASDLRTGMS